MGKNTIKIKLHKLCKDCSRGSSKGWVGAKLQVPPSLIGRAWEVGKVRATSHTRLKAHDHCNLRALIGRKGGDRPSSLHIRRWRPKGPKRMTWMKSLHGILHGGLWKRCQWSPGIYVMPTSKRWAWRKFRETIIFSYLLNMIDSRAHSIIDSRIDFRTDKHHQVVLSNWQSLRHIVLNQILSSFSAHKIDNGPATWSILTSHYAWGSVTT